MYTSSVKVAAGVVAMIPTPECRVRAYGGNASVVTTWIDARTAYGAPIAMEPRSGANKDSTGEPLWSIVTIGCTRIWVIGIVAIRAHRSRPYVDRTYADREAEELREFREHAEEFVEEVRESCRLEAAHPEVRHSEEKV